MMVQAVGVHLGLFCNEGTIFSVEESLGMLFRFFAIFLDDFLNGHLITITAEFVFPLTAWIRV
jgi:hypothetical protein